MRRRHVLASAAVLVVGLTACGGSTAGAASPEEVRTEVQFSSQLGTGGITYDPALVPVGASAVVTATTRDGGEVVTLTLRGVLPDRTYGAHAHTNACGETGDAAGPHFQFDVDPVQPSVDPRWANPQNEVWLDLTTDASGTGTSTATLNKTFPDDRRPRSVVVHAMKTSTEEGKAGTAGARAACLDVPF
ncbi:superoxide dismutase, Cu-Zn family [Pseudonocardia thermophila]|mgnify:CR=1 FL=1|jgi:Cu/Zn superoxide dismutase|uniref:Superoxide dismutase, Cu-Zn family n=1 Tax=Pseudonocardia thermophila TaxID=1848 RepID=A0A1M6SAB3_PSETH|nr:superoxide dismutase family protein [Pseudonocardia thermophila]SHK41661.1 superoxide dismutase, Cu-Zn family [Pseudonocardia thermophila]